MYKFISLILIGISCWYWTLCHFFGQGDATIFCITLYNDFLHNFQNLPGHCAKAGDIPLVNVWKNFFGSTDLKFVYLLTFWLLFTIQSRVVHTFCVRLYSATNNNQKATIGLAWWISMLWMQDSSGKIPHSSTFCIARVSMCTLSINKWTLRNLRDTSIYG